MAHYAVIENGNVVNTVEADAEYALQNGWVAAEKEVCIGWVYLDGNFIDERPIEALIDDTPVQPTKEELIAQIELLTKQIQAL
jgi:hypothetical protein